MKRVEIQQKAYHEVAGFPDVIETYGPVEITGRWKTEVVNGDASVYLEVEEDTFLSWITNRAISTKKDWIHESQLQVQTINEYVNGIS